MRVKFASRLMQSVDLGSARVGADIVALLLVVLVFCSFAVCCRLLWLVAFAVFVVGFVFRFLLGT